MNNDKEKSKLYKREYYNTVDNSTKDAFSTELIVNENDINTKAVNLIEQALNLIETKAFDKAIYLMRRAIGFFNQINNKEKVEAIRKRMSEIYILKEQSGGDFEDKDQNQQPLIKLHEQTQDIDLTINIHEEKLSEKDLSDEAIKAIREAKVLIEVEEFDDALVKYDEAIKIYKRTNNESKIQQIYELIEKCYDYKSEFLKKPKITAPHKVDIVEKADIQIKEREDQEKLKRIIELEHKKEEEESFQQKIDNLVNHANKLEREYDSEKRKAIKDGKLLNIEAPYQQIIEIYQEIQRLLINRGWKDSAKIYVDQIKLCKEKLEGDKKLREIEVQKIQKQKNYDANLKFRDFEEQTGPEALKLRAAQEKYQKELEDEFFQKQITEVIDNVEKMSREYEIRRTKAIKEGILDFKSVYPKLIKIHNEVIRKLHNRGWIAQIKPYQESIEILKDNQKNDERLREVEAQKIMKRKEYEDFIKADNGVVRTKVGTVTFETQINEMIDKAIKIERKYEIAIRRGRIDETPPYKKIIEIYTRVGNMLIKVGKADEAKIYNEQIELAKLKLEKTYNM